jgi:hypothetical protein
MKLADKLADIILAEKETNRQFYNKVKELERDIQGLVMQTMKIGDLERALKAAQAEVLTLDKMLQDELRLKKQTDFVSDIDQLDLFI